MKNEVMADATAEIFALGECDALFIPNYSSFTLSSIVLTERNQYYSGQAKELSFMR